LRSARTVARSNRASRLGVRAKIDYVPAAKVEKLVLEDGYTLVDIRDSIQYDRSHFKNSEYIPLYVPDNGTDFQSRLNQQLHAGSVGNQFGTKHTVRNTEFESMVAAKFNKDAKLLLCCQQGLRSNGAAQELAASGFSDLAVIEGGLNQLKENVIGSLETEGKEKIWEAGKGGTNKYIREISFTVGGVMGAMYIALEFFPDASKDVLAKLYGLS